MSDQFKEDVRKGLQSSPKAISSKYFYDETGDQLFIEIMKLPEYYLTRAEDDIFSNKTSELAQSFQAFEKEFDLIELGAGDGWKTKKLLSYLLQQNVEFKYLPIDISSNSLKNLNTALKQEFPDLEVIPQQGDYFEVLDTLKDNGRKKVILFLGSNIGNLEDHRAKEFMSKLSKNLNSGDYLVLGVDLIKAESVVLPAYNDTKGITSKFNLNLLRRINHELNANFDLSAFDHFPTYNEDEGIARSAIRSLKDQVVTIKELQMDIKFNEDELIHTEISRKYNDQIIQEITRDSSFVSRSKIQDKDYLFADYIFKVQ